MDLYNRINYVRQLYSHVGLCDFFFFFCKGNKTDACNKITPITEDFMYNNDWISIKFVSWDSVVGILTRLQTG